MTNARSDPEQTLEDCIKQYRSALAYLPKTFMRKSPYSWANVHLKLGDKFLQERQIGTPEANFMISMDHVNKALEVFTG
jgi:hypothetical protein